MSALFEICEWIFKGVARLVVFVQGIPAAIAAFVLSVWALVRGVVDNLSGLIHSIADWVSSLASAIPNIQDLSSSGLYHCFAAACSIDVCLGSMGAFFALALALMGGLLALVAITALTVAVEVVTFRFAARLIMLVCPVAKV